MVDVERKAWTVVPGSLACSGAAEDLETAQQRRLALASPAVPAHRVPYSPAVALPS